MMKRVLLILIALAVLLTACQSAPVVVMAEPEEEEYTYIIEEYQPEPPPPEPPPAPRPEPEPPPPSLTREDYIAMLYALQDAFATGDFEAFIEAYPGWDEEGRDMPGPAVNEWPALLEGVTAVMTFDEEDFDFDPNARSNVATVQLYVSGGNRHLPNGEQTLLLNLIRNRDTNTPSIYVMMLNTDGRQMLRFDGRGWLWPQPPSFYDQVEELTMWMVSVARSGLTIDRVVLFIDVFGGRIGGDGSHTEEEMIEGARRFLGVENFAPMDYAFIGWDAGDFQAAREEGRSTSVWYEDGRFFNPGRGFYPPPLSVIILDTPTEGDMTARAFIYANWLFFEVERIIDFNFLVMYDEDGVPYARLLSEQLREDLL